VRVAPTPILPRLFWQLAEALPALRLAGITVLAIVVMSGWLMVHNNLWDSPSGHLERQKALLYNASTALTLSIGVACMYAILFVLALLASIVLIEGSYFGQVLGHPAGPASYLKLVWLSTSVGIVAGAVGSSPRRRGTRPPGDLQPARAGAAAAQPRTRRGSRRRRR
jgi:hypothetical protein